MTVYTPVCTDARITLADCHPALQEQWSKWQGDTVTVAAARRSPYYRIAKPWLDAGYVCIPSKSATDKEPGLWKFAHLHTGGTHLWTEADLVTCARMLPRSAGLVLGGSHVDPERRVICLDNDTTLPSVDEWITATFGPATLARSGREGGGTHHLYIADPALVPYRGQSSRNGQLGPDEAWEEKEDPKTGKLRWVSGVDVKAQGGYFVAPGSRHWTGRIYHLVGSEPGPITAEQIAAIPRLQGNIEAHVRACPTHAEAAPGEARSGGYSSSSRYTPHTAELAASEWSWVHAHLADLQPGQHIRVPCPLHDHQNRGNPGEVWILESGRRGFTCHGRGECHHFDGAPERAPDPAVQLPAEPKPLPEWMLRFVDYIVAKRRYHGFLRGCTGESHLTVGFLADLFDGDREAIERDLEEARVALAAVEEEAIKTAWCPGSRTNTTYKNDRMDWQTRPCMGWSCPICGWKKKAGTRASAESVVRDWTRSGMRCATTLLPTDANGRTAANKRASRWAGEDAENRLVLRLQPLPDAMYGVVFWRGDEEDAPAGYEVAEDSAQAVDNILAMIDPALWGQSGVKVCRVLGGMHAATAPICKLRDQLLDLAPNPAEVEEEEQKEKEIREAIREGLRPYMQVEDVADLDAELDRQVEERRAEALAAEKPELLLCGVSESPEEIVAKVADYMEVELRLLPPTESGARYVLVRPPGVEVADVAQAIRDMRRAGAFRDLRDIHKGENVPEVGELFPAVTP